MPLTIPAILQDLFTFQFLESAMKLRERTFAPVISLVFLACTTVALGLIEVPAVVGQSLAPTRDAAPDRAGEPAPLMRSRDRGNSIDTAPLSSPASPDRTPMNTTDETWLQELLMMGMGISPFLLIFVIAVIVTAHRKYQGAIFGRILYCLLAITAFFVILVGGGAALEAQKVDLAKQASDKAFYAVCFLGLIVASACKHLAGVTWKEVQHFGKMTKQAPSGELNTKAPRGETTRQLSSVAVFSLVLCLLPYIGLPMAIASARKISKSDGRLYGKTLAWVSVVVNSLLLAAMVFGIIMGVLSSK